MSVHYIVTGRRCGDDESTLLILEADSDAAAMEAYKEELRAVHGLPEPTTAAEQAALDNEETDADVIYIDHVVRCEGPKPVLRVQNV